MKPIPYRFYAEEELKNCIQTALMIQKFDTEEIAPLVKVDGTYFLELFHGSDDCV